MNVLGKKVPKAFFNLSFIIKKAQFRNKIERNSKSCNKRKSKYNCFEKN